MVLHLHAHLFFSPSSDMVSKLLILMLGAAWAQSGDEATANPKTFGMFPPGTYEPIPQTFNILNGSIIHQGTFALQNPSNIRNDSGIRIERISEQARVFLTGPTSTILIPSFYTLVCLISVPINICAVIAFTRRIRPKKPAAIYMLNLAFADLLFALLLPFKISYHFRGNDWVYGDAMCRVVTAAFFWNMYCSVLLITCISVDRLLAVVYPIASLTWRRPQKAITVCVFMWILSFAGVVPLVIRKQTVYHTDLNITTCHDVSPIKDIIWFLRIYFISLCCFLFFLPVLITVFSYTRLIWSLSRVPKSVPGRSDKRKRAIVMALTVLMIFLLCFAPTNCLLLFHYIKYNEGVQTPKDAPDGYYATYLVFMCLGSVNCLLDPLVYFFGSSQCQRELLSALRCQKIPEQGSNKQSSSDSYRFSTRTILKISHA